MDDFGGSKYEPLTYHKYAYGHNDPITNIDPTGMFSLAGRLAVASISGGLFGITGNGLANVAQGQGFFNNAAQAYLFGAIAGPLAYLSPAFAVGLSGLNTLRSLSLVYDVVGDTNSSTGQHVAAFSLLGLSLFGNYASVRHVRANGFWVNQNAFSSNSVVPQLPNSQQQPQITPVARVTQDINVNPNPPAALNPVGRTIGGNSAQNTAVGRFVTSLMRLGAEDIRVNQQQVNAQGVRVGINRPDLQFTWRGLRYYIEWDAGNSSRGIPHAQRTLANDPSGATLTYSLD